MLLVLVLLVLQLTTTQVKLGDWVWHGRLAWRACGE
jgi:hypothetical protein